eukprot:TRINITY_DN80487_c0_g1_i1.p1 TRINITY_DN80487_c0_g1~~TRINITY_DN80487_c0_g1_i1.p1  ORF type:complete len:375 (-),score=53.30 TRINITY_DN80487_c0_g1_i1:70-1194(-)
MPSAIILAATGGVLWAFGILGKRLGVEGAPTESKQLRASLTILVYVGTTIIIPAADFIWVGFDDVSQLFRDETWAPRIPLIVVCGVVSGLGGLLGTLAFAYAAGTNSALISMVENGVYTVSGALYIAVYFHEMPAPLSWVGCVLIMIGVLLAQASSGKKPVREADDEAEQSSQSDSDTAAEEETAETDNGNSDTGDMFESDPGTFDGTGTTPAPVRLRKTAVILAVSAGACWGMGSFGKKYGVADAPEDKKSVWTVCTYFIYMVSTIIVPLVRVAMIGPSETIKTLHDRTFRCLLLGVLICGLISGGGGLISTAAFAAAKKGSGSIVSVVENGVYTVLGALLIVIAFKEKPTVQQGLAAVFVVGGIVLSGLATG